MAKAASRKVMSLDGEWRYRPDPERTGDPENLFEASATSDWRTMRVPANWYTTELGDYHGVVWFVRKFEVGSELNDRELILRFNAVDYRAEVWLNGTYLSSHEAPIGWKSSFEMETARSCRGTGSISR